jgi:hypothetical protein
MRGSVKRRLTEQAADKGARCGTLIFVDDEDADARRRGAAHVAEDEAEDGEKGDGQNEG